MYRLFGIILTAAMVAGSPNVLQLKKMMNMSKLLPLRFHEFNRGHVIFNYCTPKARETMQVRNFHNLHYTGQVSIGEPGQKLNVVFEIALGDIMVLSPHYCKHISKITRSFCWNHHSYNIKKSKTWTRAENLKPVFSLCPVAGSEFFGHLVYDNIKIADTTLLQAKIGVVKLWKQTFFNSKIDGIVGLGLRDSSYFALHENVKNVTENDAMKIAKRPSLSEDLVVKGIKKIAFHLYKDSKGEELGQLILGAENENHRYKGDLTWTKQPPKKPFWSAFWKFDVAEIFIMGMSDGDIEKIDVPDHFTSPDPGTSLIAGPPSLINKIHNHLFNGLERPERNDRYGTIEFDCRYRAQLPIIVFRIGQRGYILEPNDYVKMFKSSCTTGFMAVEKLGLLVLGDTFLRKYYITFDLENEMMGLAESIPPSI